MKHPFSKRRVGLQIHGLWLVRYEYNWRNILSTYDRKTSVNLWKIDFSNDVLTFSFGWYVDTQKYHKGRDNHNKLHATRGHTKSLTQGDKFGLLEFQDNSVSHNGPPQKFSIFYYRVLDKQYTLPLTKLPLWNHFSSTFWNFWPIRLQECLLLWVRSTQWLSNFLKNARKMD